jgi:hypothetical protein
LFCFVVCYNLSSPCTFMGPRAFVPIPRDVTALRYGLEMPRWELLSARNTQRWRVPPRRLPHAPRAAVFLCKHCVCISYIAYPSHIAPQSIILILFCDRHGSCSQSRCSVLHFVQSMRSNFQEGSKFYTHSKTAHIFCSRINR